MEEFEVNISDFNCHCLYEKERLQKKIVCLYQLLKLEFYFIYCNFLECSPRNLLKDKAVHIIAMYPETDYIKIVALCLLYKLELLVFHELLKINTLRFYLIND